MKYIKTFEAYSDLPIDIKEFQKKVSLYEVSKKIYAVQIHDGHLRAMTFLRYQEFYEASSDDFRGNHFTWDEYSDWYKKEYGDFTYSDDWSGFNLPSKAIEECMKGIKDFNKYDEIMSCIIKSIREIENGDFYLLGVDNLDLKEDDISRIVDGTEEGIPDLVHELAHGFYYVDPVYKSEMNHIIDNMDEKVRERISNLVIKWGYNKVVLNDEIQAHMATGVVNGMDGLEKYTKPFIEFFKEYVSSIGIDNKKIEINWNEIH
jgi:hypothetical protein